MLYLDLPGLSGSAIRLAPMPAGSPTAPARVFRNLSLVASSWLSRFPALTAPLAPLVTVFRFPWVPSRPVPGSRRKSSRRNRQTPGRSPVPDNTSPCHGLSSCICPCQLAAAGLRPFPPPTSPGGSGRVFLRRSPLGSTGSKLPSSWATQRYFPIGITIVRFLRKFFGMGLSVSPVKVGARPSVLHFSAEHRAPCVWGGLLACAKHTPGFSARIKKASKRGVKGNKRGVDGILGAQRTGA